MFATLSTVLLTLVVSLILLSIFEWSFHRYIMHKRVPWFDYPYKKHQIIHHRVFGWDDSYHLIFESQEEGDIKMELRTGVALILLAWSPDLLLAGILWIFGISIINIIVMLSTCLLVCIAYYVAYEYIHWCMHLPKNRRLEMSWVFQRLNGHHILHHRFMWKNNYNVVFPFADLIFGTLLTRSTTRFRQVSGPNVPDVQPLNSS